MLRLMEGSAIVDFFCHSMQFFTFFLLLDVFSMDFLGKFDKNRREKRFFYITLMHQKFVFFQSTSV